MASAKCVSKRVWGGKKTFSKLEFARIVFGLKNIGETHTYEKGFTVGINDLAQFSKERDAIYNHIAQKAKNASQEELSKLNKIANGLLEKVMSDKLKDKNNPLYPYQ